MTFELNCPGCGDNRFIYPEAVDAPVRCEQCGTSIGSYREVQQRLADAVTSGGPSRIPRFPQIDQPLSRNEDTEGGTGPAARSAR